jgi:hypothetical protein
VLIGVGFWQRQNVIDWYQLRGYEAPIPIAALATKAEMSDKARRIFYVNKPEIQEKATFYKSCEEGETAVVLGCYKPRNGIYLLKVDDQRLAGVEEVTAAHEMLHAAYGRLDVRQQRRIAKLLNDAYANISDASISDKVALYKQSGADVTNELHSILGTEVAKLPPELETYYQQYFSNRQTVVTFAAHYQAEFTSRKNKVIAYDKQLADIEQQVNSNNKDLDTQQAALQAESARLDALLKNGDIAEYNAGVGAYNQSIVPFRNLLSQTRGLVEQYKTILAERNAVAVEAQELNKALDSRIQTNAQDIP